MTRRKFQELNLSNAYLFAAAMEDEGTCKITLEMLLERKIEKVLAVIIRRKWMF